MSMTVGQLIKALKKFPANAVVGIQDHDANEWEVSSMVLRVTPYNPTGVEQESPEYIKWTKGVKVIIRGGG